MPSPTTAHLSRRQLLKNLILFTFPSALLTLLSFIGSGYLCYTILSSPQFLSPLPTNPPTLSTTTQASSAQQKITLGFLPFWNLKYEKQLNYQLLTDLAFFGLDIETDGSIRKIKEEGFEEPGWTTYKSQELSAAIRKAKEQNTRTHLVIRAMQGETVESIVNNPQHRQQAIEQIVEVLQNRNFDGLNIDFEYAVAPHYTTAKNFTQFVTDLSEKAKKALPHLIVTIDVYADAAKNVRIWEIDKLAPHVDYFIIMAYDFHRTSSALAGPVAPLRGAPDRWQYDITQTLTDYFKIISAEKIILGVPYYGYEWHTTSDKVNSTTYPQSGALATYKRVQEIIANQNTAIHWDQDSLSPWLSYQESGITKQIYYEDCRSLGLKYALVNQTGLAGTAIWALGYDGGSDNLWHLLSQHFH